MNGSLDKAIFERKGTDRLFVSSPCKCELAEPYRVSQRVAMHFVLTDWLYYRGSPGKLFDLIHTEYSILALSHFLAPDSPFCTIHSMSLLSNIRFRTC